MARQLSYTEAIAEALTQSMEKDANVFLFGEGVDNVTGVYGTVLPAFKKFGNSRVIDTPLSENGLTGIAVGASLKGFRPVLFHQRNDFIMLTMDQLVNHAAKIRYMTGGRHKVPLTIVSFIARKVGEGAQHSQSLQALFAHIPGLKVIMPATPYDAKGLLISAIRDEDPVVVLFHRTLFDAKESVPEGFYEIPIGKARLVKQGRDVTVIATSALVKDALQAAKDLAEIADIEIIDLRSIRPFDKELISQSVKKTGRVIVCDTGWKSFGVSAEISAYISEENFRHLKTAPKRVALLEIPAPASPYLEKFYHPKADDIIKAIRAIVLA